MVSTLRDLAQDGRLGELRAWLDEHGTLEIADALARLDPDERAVPFRLLDKGRALAVFEALDPVHQQQLLDALRDERVVELVSAMAADDRARLLDEMPAKVAARLTVGLSASERQATATLLGYPPDSAGRIMSPDFISLRATMTATEAVAKLRGAGRRQQRSRAVVLPVTDGQRHLVGVVDLLDLVTAPPDTVVADLTRPETLFVRATDDQEVAARLIQEADLVALPVVDREDRLVGLVTVDDAMEVLEEEETEDISRAGGAEPLDRPYLAASVAQLARKRVVWLLVLIAAAALTVNVLQYFEGTLATVVTLALFIPLLIGTGGNCGAQAATVVVRAMAVGEVRFTDLSKIIWREALVGVLLGAMLAAVGFPLVAVYTAVTGAGGWDFAAQMAAVVSLTMVSVCTWASFVGGLLPVLAKRIGIDPAVVSAPLITTLVDATGLVIYFLIARAILL